MKYLVDSSALIRLVRRQADSSWDELAGRGLLSICEPVLAETLLIAPAKEYAATEDDLTDAYVPIAIPDQIWDWSAVIRRELALHGAHKGLSATDLVIAATAIRMKLTVLHEDADYETIARYVPELRQHRMSRGLEDAL